MMSLKASEEAVFGWGLEGLVGAEHTGVGSYSAERYAEIWADDWGLSRQKLVEGGEGYWRSMAWK